MSNKTVGELLQSAGLATAQQIQECEQEATKTNLPVDRCLVSKGITTEVAIAKAFADYAKLPLLETITEKMTDPGLLEKVPLRFLRDNVIIPLMIDEQLTIACANPLIFSPLDDLNLLLGGGAQFVVIPRNIINDAINRYYPLEGAREAIEELEEEHKDLTEVSFEELEGKDILTMATEAPIIKLVNNILYQAVKRGASDIHIEPFEKEVRVRYRIDGVMYNVMNPPKRIQSALISRIKIMANLNIAEKRLPQDGRIPLKVADKAIDIRVSILPVAFGERVVMRLLDKSRTFSSIDKLGFNERDYTIVSETIERPNGIIFLTGPTGSGKTSTLYSILGALNKPEVNIVTVEDPVEYQMDGIGQVQVKEKIGLTFAAALRSILRQDPDIVMIGEIRDQETAQIAIQAALTGHLVLSTLHTNSAPATITRLTDMGIEPFLIASSVVLAIGQRLVRRLCESCKKPYKPTEDLLRRLGISKQEAESIIFYQPIGCADCLETGYKGRLAIFEVMPMTTDIAKLTMEHADTGQLHRQAIADGMSTLLTDGIRRIREGITTIDEVLAVAALEE